MWSYTRLLTGFLFVLLAALAASSAAFAGDKGDILKNLHTIDTIASTLPANQDKWGTRRPCREQFEA